jgi:hypothetical protein
MVVSGIRSVAVAGWSLLMLAAPMPFANGQVVAQQQACGKPEFEAVVETAAVTLRDLNARNKPGFQDKLRALKDKRGWTTEQFMAEAAVYVQDDQINAFDTKSGELLARINTMGEAGASSNTPDCKLLGDLRATMKSLVDTQTEKWVYMFSKIEKALSS